MKLMTGLGIMAMVGLTVGIALFSLTSGHLGTLQTFSTPPCPQVNADPTAFDPLTGLPYGYTFVCRGGGGSIHQSVPAQQAIPVPLGFLLGAAAAGLVLLVDVGRRRRAGDARTN